MSNSSFTLNLKYQISNVNMSTNFSDKNGTIGLIQNSINNLLNVILCSPKGSPVPFPRANFINEQNWIRANVSYIYKVGDITQPSNFLLEVLKASGLEVTTTTAPTTTTKLNPPLMLTAPLHGATSAGGGGKFPAWALAIIIPCGIIIILIPLWILLCCLLCGCCAGLKRRWRRRRSFLMQYRVHSDFI
ncbi:cell wall protein DAN4-like [Arapaima gigas]